MPRQCRHRTTMRRATTTPKPNPLIHNGRIVASPRQCANPLIANDYDIGITWVPGGVRGRSSPLTDTNMTTCATCGATTTCCTCATCGRLPPILGIWPQVCHWHSLPGEGQINYAKKVEKCSILKFHNLKPIPLVENPATRADIVFSAKPWQV